MPSCDGTAAAEASVAVDPASSWAVSPAEVVGSVGSAPVAELCPGAALMLSMRVSTILTAVCKAVKEQSLDKTRSEAKH